ncbi:MAG: DNA mismatch repair endonuclease MutL, partial [Psychrobacter faecalis]
MPDNPSNSRIKKLSPLLINQLAAGEVVTRPAAVVKELLENAIDAGASNIEIRITQGGMGMIEVLDNGTGIHPDDMVMAITRHATSKVADVANLHGITTLGFRGEALAATAAVSRLTLTSSHDDSGIGRQLQVAGVLDEVPKLLPVVHQRGTTITVKDLYFNVPARRGNLKSIATEFGHIETIVREVALARADVALTLFHDNKKRLSLSSRAMSANDNDNTNSSNNNAHRLPLSRLEQATGLPLTDNALEISIDLTSLMQLPKDYVNSNFAGQANINGWLWLSNDSQSTFPKLIYVNGRLVKEALISNQLRQLAQSAQLSGIGYALYFDLPTDWLNINVHPSKQRIKISPLNNIMAHLSHAIQPKLKTVATKQNINQTINSADDNSQVLDN